MLLIFICGWSASDRTGVAGAAASRDIRVILTAVTPKVGAPAGEEVNASKFSLAIVVNLVGDIFGCLCSYSISYSVTILNLRCPVFFLFRL